MELWITLVALYAWQCIVRLAVPGAIFGPRWHRRGELRRSGAKALSPWPSTLGVVATPLPFDLTPDAMALVVRDPTPSQGEQPIPLEPLALERRQTKLLSLGRSVLRAASKAEAARWEEWIRRLAALPSAERNAGFRALVDASLDADGLATELASARHATRWLAALCDALLVSSMLGVPLAGLFLGSDYVLAIALPALGVLYLVTLVLAFLAHRRLFPARRGERIEDLSMAALYPPVLLRLPQVWVDAATTGHHPLAWIRVLSPEAEARSAWLRESARLEWQAARDESRRARAVCEFDAVQAHMPGPWRRLARREAQDPTAASYCAICWEDFRPGFARCPSCDAATIPYAPAPAQGT